MTSEILREVERLDGLRRKAMVDRDLAVLDDLLSDDLIYVHNNAMGEGKAEYMEKLKSGLYHYFEVAQPELALRSVGDRVVLSTGRTVLKVKLPDGTNKTVDGTTVTVWSNASGKWRMEYYQGTPRPQG